MFALKEPTEYWNEVSLVALDFYKNLPEEARMAMQKRLESLYPSKGMERFMVNYEVNGALHPHIFNVLIDFVPIEQAICLLRYEIWSCFAQKRPSPESVEVMWEQYDKFIQYIQNIYKINDFHSNWYDSEKYKLEHIKELFEAEIYAIFMRIRQDFYFLEQDFNVIMPCINHIYKSIEKSIYKTYFLQAEIQVQGDKFHKRAQKNKMQNARKRIVKELSRVPILHIQEDNPFAPLIGEYLAQISLDLEQERQIKQLQVVKNGEHLQEIIDNFRENNAGIKFSKVKAVLEMQGGTLYVQFSTQMMLYKKFLEKPIKYFRIVAIVLAIIFLPFLLLMIFFILLSPFGMLI